MDLNEHPGFLKPEVLPPIHDPGLSAFPYWERNLKKGRTVYQFLHSVKIGREQFLAYLLSSKHLGIKIAESISNQLVNNRYFSASCYHLVGRPNTYLGL